VVNGHLFICQKDCAVYFCGTGLDKVQGENTHERKVSLQTARNNAAGRPTVLNLLIFYSVISIVIMTQKYEFYSL